MKITAQKNTELEHDIRPPMAKVVTLPLLVDGKNVGVALYVALSSFAPMISGAEVKGIAEAVADAINLSQSTPKVAALMKAALRAAFLIDTLPGGHQDVSDDLRDAVSDFGDV